MNLNLNLNLSMCDFIFLGDRQRDVFSGLGFSRVGSNADRWESRGDGGFWILGIWRVGKVGECCWG